MKRLRRRVAIIGANSAAIVAINSCLNANNENLSLTWYAEPERSFVWDMPILTINANDIAGHRVLRRIVEPWQFAVRYREAARVFGGRKEQCIIGDKIYNYYHALNNDSLLLDERVDTDLIERLTVARFALAQYDCLLTNVRESAKRVIAKANSLGVAMHSKDSQVLAISESSKGAAFALYVTTNKDRLPFDFVIDCRLQYDNCKSVDVSHVKSLSEHTSFAQAPVVLFANTSKESILAVGDRSSAFTASTSDGYDCDMPIAKIALTENTTNLLSSARARTREAAVVFNNVSRGFPGSSSDVASIRTDLKVECNNPVLRVVHFGAIHALDLSEIIRRVLDGILQPR